jgi:hypothetical protein
VRPANARRAGGKSGRVEKSKKRRLGHMIQNRENQVELYRAYSVEEILERRELFGSTFSTSSHQGGSSG